jgi:hypothetical protein
MQKEAIPELAKRLQTPDWLLAGAKIRLGWVEGLELTETDYINGLKKFKNAPTHPDLLPPPLAKAAPLEADKAALEKAEADKAALEKTTAKGGSK